MRISSTRPPSSDCRTCICRAGMTRPWPRLTSSRMAKCAQVVPVTSRRTTAASSMREVRGVRSSAAARTWLAKVKSDSRNGLYSLSSRLGNLGRTAAQHRNHLFTRAVGNKSPALEQEDAVDKGEQRQAMRGNEDGHVIGGDVLEPCEEVGLAAHVKMRGRLVEEQNLGLSDQGTGQPDRLLLSARETTPAFGDRHVVAEGVAGDDVLDAGETRGSDDFLVGRGRFSKRDIVADLAEEKIGVLQHETDAGAQIRRVVLARVNIVDDYFPFGGLVEAAQQAADGGLAGADTADDSDTLAAGDLERDLVERSVIGAGIVERYVLEGNAAFFDVPRNVHALRRTLTLEVHDAINALERNQSLCSAGDDGGNARDRCEHATRQHGAGDQHADSDLTVEDEEDADDDHQQVIELLCSVGAGERQRRPAVHFLAGAGSG